LLNDGIAELLNEALDFIGVDFGRLHICLQRRQCGIDGIIENLLIIPGQQCHRRDDEPLDLERLKLLSWMP
jgi:hypothetical protein